MSKRAFRAAVVVAALGILLGLAPPAMSSAAAPRDDGAEVTGDRPAGAGFWQSLAELWDGVVAAVFAGSEGDENGENGNGAPPENGGEEEDPPDSGDSGPGQDPTG